jgi:hypothetical protein
MLHQQLQELKSTVATLDAELAGPKQGVEELAAQVGTDLGHRRHDTYGQKCMQTWRNDAFLCSQRSKSGVMCASAYHTRGISLDANRIWTPLRRCHGHGAHTCTCWLLPCMAGHLHVV